MRFSVYCKNLYVCSPLIWLHCRFACTLLAIGRRYCTTIHLTRIYTWNKKFTSPVCRGKKINYVLSGKQRPWYSGLCADELDNVVHNRDVDWKKTPRYRYKYFIRLMWWVVCVFQEIRVRFRVRIITYGRGGKCTDTFISPEFWKNIVDILLLKCKMESF